MRLLLALLLAFATAPVSAIGIANLKSGLVCHAGKPGSKVEDWICQPTQDVLLTDHGRCVYDGVTRACTWFGFEFDYTDNAPGTRLQCLGETSQPIANGNPREILSESSTSQPFELVLPAAKGHFINTMYHLFSVRAPGSPPLVQTVTCKAGDAVLLQARFNLHFPQADK